MIDKNQLLETAIEACRAAGPVLIDNLSTLSGSDIDLKGRNDYVTDVDREAERRIVELILSRFPDHRILAEEGGARQGSGAVRWIIDPLDGTTNYIHSYPAFAVSVAAEAEGRIVAAAVLDPTRDELFTAAAGGGAFLNGRPISVSAISKLERALLLTGFPFKALHYLEDFITVFRDLLGATSGIRRCGSAALDLAHLAAGRADGFWEFGLSPWDVAAGALLIQEAGGRITDVELGDRHIRTGNVLASNGLLHEFLHEGIMRHFEAGRFVPPPG